MKQTVLVTGATGFVGRALCARLVRAGHAVHGTFLAKENPSMLASGVVPVLIESIGPDTPWDALAGIDIVIHLAARVHVMRDTAKDPLSEFRAVNTLGTARLVERSLGVGVKRFIFMSTIGVNGDSSPGRAFSEADEPHPHNPYSVSKHEAERALVQIAENRMEFVIVRAPLVYGPGNPGNFLTLLKVLGRGLPLPFASINNRRSLIYVGNLVDALAVCASHPAAAGETFLVSDGEDISTPELLRRTALALGVSVRLLPFSASLMRIGGQIVGKSAAVKQLVGSLTLDTSKIRRVLDWEPPFKLDEGLQHTAEWFKREGA